MGFFLFLLLFLLLAIFFLFVITSAFLGFVITRVPFVPTPSHDIPLLVQRVKLSRKDTILDLGSGNGRVVFLLEKLTRARVFGYEATLWTHWWAQLKKQVRRSRATFVYGNFFKHDWGHATAIYIYLYPPLMPRIVDKIHVDCRPGTLIISRDFPLSGLRQIDTFRSSPSHWFYIYKV